MNLGSADLSGVSDLYRSDTLVVRLVAAPDRDRYVVTFDNYGIGHGFDRPGFGQDWLAAQGISAIHVMGRAEDWYQYPDIEAALSAVRAATLGASKVITYGSSMGGYAAIRFADAVGAHRALAFSPQYTLDPAVAGHEARWSQDSRRIRWRPELNRAIRCSAEAVIVYDPCGPDRWHADRIAQDVPVAHVRLPHTGHPATTYLAEVHLLAPLVLSVLDGPIDARDFQRRARALRGSSGVYLGDVAARLSRRRIVAAVAVARRAVEVSGGNDLARLSLARLLLRSGERDEALALFENLVEVSGRNQVFLVAHGQALAEAGRMPEARIIADEVMAGAGQMAHLHGWAATIYWLNGNVPEARAAIRTAARLDPGNRGYINALTDYHLSRRGAAVQGMVPSALWRRVFRWAARRLLYRDRPELRTGRLSGSEPAHGS